MTDDDDDGSSGDGGDYDGDDDGSDDDDADGGEYDGDDDEVDDRVICIFSPVILYGRRPGRKQMMPRFPGPRRFPATLGPINSTLHLTMSLLLEKVNSDMRSFTSSPLKTPQSSWMSNISAKTFGLFLLYL